MRPVAQTTKCLAIVELRGVADKRGLLSVGSQPLSQTFSRGEESWRVKISGELCRHGGVMKLGGWTDGRKAGGCVHEPALPHSEFQLRNRPVGLSSLARLGACHNASSTFNTGNQHWQSLG